MQIYFMHICLRKNNFIESIENHFGSFYMICCLFWWYISSSIWEFWRDVIHRVVPKFMVSPCGIMFKFHQKIISLKIITTNWFWPKSPKNVYFGVQWVLHGSARYRYFFLCLHIAIWVLQASTCSQFFATHNLPWYHCKWVIFTCRTKSRVQICDICCFTLTGVTPLMLVVFSKLKKMAYSAQQTIFEPTCAHE